MVASTNLTLKTVNVTANDADDARDKANPKLSDRERQLIETSEAEEVSSGTWRVKFTIYEERLLVRTPKSVKEIY